jgi:hypothetical protein
LAKGKAAGAVAVVASDYLGASAMIYTGLTEPETLEALAIREGLNLAQDLNPSSIVVASNCLSVAKSLKEDNLGRYCHIISISISISTTLKERERPIQYI